MTQYKYGLIDPEEHLDGIKLLNEYVLEGSVLPTPDLTVGYQADVTSWPMALNDQLGDCTIAGIEHVLEVHAAEVKQTFPYPGDDATRTTYTGLTGGPDTGLLLSTVINAGSTTGLFGHKVVGAAQIVADNVVSLKQSIDFWGAAYAGVNCPDSAQQQFNPDGTGIWRVVPDATVEGGHCIIFVGYDQQYLYAVTWGGIVRVEWHWWSVYGTQAFALITDFFVDVGHGPTNSLDLAAMQSDLQALAAP